VQSITQIDAKDVMCHRRGGIMINFIKNLLVLTLTLTFTGCLSMTSLQTAKTMPRNTSQLQGAIGVYNSPTLDEEVDGDNIRALFLEAGFRYGYRDNLEVGGKMTIAIPPSFAADMKYNLINREKFALAIGAGVGFMNYDFTGEGFISSSDSETTVSVIDDDDEATIFMLDVVIPLYISYDVTESFALYTSPKYISRRSKKTSTINGVKTKTDKELDLVGAAVGVRLGSKWGIFLEGTFMSWDDPDTNMDQDLNQYTVALFINLQGVRDRR